MYALSGPSIYLYTLFYCNYMYTQLLWNSWLKIVVNHISRRNHCYLIHTGVLALTGSVIPGEMYAWTAVLILPINSALNPFMYTFSAIISAKVNIGNISNWLPSTVYSVHQTQHFDIISKYYLKCETMTF